MLKYCLTIAWCSFAGLVCGYTQNHKVVKTFHIASSGGWDYISVNNGKIYVSHGSQVNILDEKSGDSIGIVPNTQGVHGIAFDNNSGKGFTSNGRSNNVTVFDLKTNKELEVIATGENPDAICFEPFTNSIITCNGRSKSLSVINPATSKVIATVDLGGKPEEARPDGSGKLYINIQNKSEIAVVDTKSWTVTNRWSLAPGEDPSGLAIDTKTHRLFATCDKLLVVMDANNGKVISKVPIGDGTDGIGFDEQNKMIYTSNGVGNMTAVKEESPNEYKVVQTIQTKPRARTMTMDQKSHAMFLPTAEFEKSTDPKARTKMIPGSFQVLVVE